MKGTRKSGRSQGKGERSQGNTLIKAKGEKSLKGERSEGEVHINSGLFPLW